MNKSLESLSTRFNKYVDKTESCWNWIGNKQKDGYGNIRLNDKKILSHRASWLIHNGDIPLEMHVLHKCDNPPCVNPEHLFLGTRKDNMQDMVKKGRHVKNLTRHKLFGKVEDIKCLLGSKQYTHQKIASMFDVSRAIITSINTGRRWGTI